MVIGRCQKRHNKADIHNLTSAEVKQRKRFYLISGKLLGDERIDVTQLCVVEFVPPLRHIEVNGDCLHFGAFIVNGVSFIDTRQKYGETLTGEKTRFSLSKRPLLSSLYKTKNRKQNL